MSEEEGRKLNLDQLWLDPSIFTDDADFASSTQSRQHEWQQQSELSREQGSGKAAGQNPRAPAPANSSISPTEIPIGLLEAAGLRDCEEDRETAASRGGPQNLYWQHDDKTRESRPGSPLPSMQNGPRPSFSGSSGQPAAKPESQEAAQDKNRARLRWTPELHTRFVQAVSKLKNADHATPKGILNLMGVEGLTIFHIKSHLQKYRANLRTSGSTELADSDTEATPKRKSSRSRRSKKKLNYADLCDDSEDEEPGTFTEARSQERAPQPDQLDRMQSPRERKRPKSAPNSVMQQPLPTPSAERQAKLKQALLLQMEMQRRLHDQLETQRQLQVSLEAHGKYISSLIEPETSSPYSTTADDALLDTLPPLELAISQGPDTLKAAPELNPALWGPNPTWDIGHSSATCLPLPDLQPLAHLPPISQSFSSPFQLDLPTSLSVQPNSSDRPHRPGSGNLNPGGAASLPLPEKRGTSGNHASPIPDIGVAQDNLRIPQGVVGAGQVGSELEWLGHSEKKGHGHPAREPQPLEKSLAGLTLPFDIDLPGASSLPTWDFAVNQTPLRNVETSQGQWTPGSQLPLSGPLPEVYATAGERSGGADHHSLQSAWDAHIASLVARQNPNYTQEPWENSNKNNTPQNTWANPQEGQQGGICRNFWEQ